MGNETKYEYVYYTIIDIDAWRRGNEEILGDEFTWEKAIDFINHKFKNSEDKTVNNYIVDYAQYCSNVDTWIRAQVRHKVRPVFIQFQDNQPITLTGEGSMFVLYEEDDEDDEVTIEQAINDRSYWNGPDGIDGLSGAGGRL